MIRLLALLLVAAQDARPAEHPYETDALREPALATGGDALIRGATIHSAVGPAREGDVLVQDGVIAAIGAGLAAPEGCVVIEAEGRHLAPGVIDVHSHLAIDGGVNEGTLSITAECDITDVIDPDDLGLYRALAGGVTAIQSLHGSANAIGGRSEVLKLRWHAEADPDALRFPGAPLGIKFALGENVKRSNWGQPGERFPGTRPGVEAVFERGFRRAQEYRAEWEAFADARARGEDPAPPRRDVRLEVLSAILAGDVLVHAHCYTAAEILMLLRTAERFGFRIKTLQHVLEGYKVAAEIAEHGAGPSTFSDWWAYKIEAFDAIPQNAALLDEAGALTTINSDSGELVRHLYHEAAKSVRYAGLDRVRALALVTINAARQLGVEDRVGSIEVGKDADLVLLSAEPLSVYARVEWTMVDGEIEFQRRDAFALDGAVLARRPLPSGELVEAGYDPDGGPVTAIVGGTLHTITGGDLENGTLLLQGRRIVDAGVGLPIPADATVFDAAGLHVWPGLIALGTPLGLSEIESIRATVDLAEPAGNQPDLRVASSLNAESAHIAVTRSAGITRAQVAPRGGGPVLGQSAVVRLAGDTWEDLLVLDRDMLHVAFPRAGSRFGRGRRAAEAPESDGPPKAILELEALFEEARAHAALIREAEAAGLRRPAFDSRLEALAPFAAGEAKVALHADDAQTILHAIRFAKEQQLDCVLYGCTEGWKVAGRIAEAGFPVVVGPVLTVPRSEYDPYDAAYANPAALFRAGVDLALMSDDAQNPRNLVDHAGFAVAFGLPREEALRAITLDAARVLGLEHELGSLSPGKLADVVITDGDLLETTTRVEALFLEGAPVDLSNKQTELYERYRERLHRVQGR